MLKEKLNFIRNRTDIRSSRITGKGIHGSDFFIFHPIRISKVAVIVIGLKENEFLLNSKDGFRPLYNLMTMN